MLKFFDATISSLPLSNLKYSIPALLEETLVVASITIPVLNSGLLFVVVNLNGLLKSTVCKFNSKTL